MAVIQFTQADKLAAKTAEKGIYPMIITEIDGPKPSASKKSVNFFVTFKITAGDLMNKEITVAFNTETSNTSILGTMQFTQSRDLMKVKAAIQGVSFDDVDLNLDTDELMNKPFDASVDIVNSGGALVNSIIAFFPIGTGAKAAAVPF